MLYIAGTGLSSIDPATGNVAKNYRQCEIQGGAFVVAPFGLLAGQSGKPLIHQYTGKETPLKKLILPEKLASIAVSVDWLAVGTQTGRLLLYSLTSGALVASQDAHFQALTHLLFTDGGAGLVSAGADARVLVWRVSELVAVQNQGSEPAHILTAHSLPITGLRLSKTDILRDVRIFTSSMDATVCVFSLFTGQLLHTLVVDKPVTALAVDPAERAIYVGGDDGVRILPLYKQSPHSRRLESVGGAGSIVSFEDATLFEGAATVTALELSQDATHLYVGDAEGGLSSWDVGTFQLVKKFKSVRGPIGALVAANPSTDFAEVPSLQRVIETELGDEVLPADPFVPQVTFDVDEALNVFSGAPRTVQVPEESNEEELEQLRAKSKQYDQLKNMYDELWARHMKK